MGGHYWRRGEREHNDIKRIAITDPSCRVGVAIQVFLFLSRFKLPKKIANKNRSVLQTLFIKISYMCAFLRKSTRIVFLRFK